MFEILGHPNVVINGPTGQGISVFLLADLHHYTLKTVNRHRPHQKSTKTIIDSILGPQL